MMLEGLSGNNGGVALATALFWFGVALLKHLDEQKKQKLLAPITDALNNKEKKMSDKKDIKDLKEVLEFGFAALSAGKEMFADGKFHADKLMSLLPVYQKAGAAFDNIGEVIPEIEDLDESEITELTAYVVSQGALSEEASKIVTKSLKVAADAYSLFKEIKN